MSTEEFEKTRQRSRAAFDVMFKQQPEVFELESLSTEDCILGKVSSASEPSIYRYHLKFKSGLELSFIGKWKSRKVIINGAKVICCGDIMLLTSQLIHRKVLGFNDSEFRENIFYKTYKSYPGYVYDENHNFWKDGYPEGLFQATYESAGGDSVLEHKMREDLGYYSLFGSSWATTSVWVREDSCWMDEKSDIYRMNFGLLERLLQICKENDIFVIGVLFPQNPRYKDTGAYGYTGLRRSEAPALIQEISDLSKVYSNFILVDENKMGNHDYTDIMGYDNSHISDYGTQQLTHRLDSLVHTLDIKF